MIPVQLLSLSDSLMKGGQRSRSQSTQSTPVRQTLERRRDLSGHNLAANRNQSAQELAQQQQQQPGGQQQPIDFGSFKTGISSGMNFLKRRFSSSDLTDEEPGAQPAGQQVPGQTRPPAPGPPPAGYAGQAKPDQSGFSLQGLSNRVSSAISAPSSPAKHQPPQSMYSQVQGITKNLFQAATGSRQAAYNKERCKCLLVIDDPNTDWLKYFRGKKILNEFELRIEQAEFSEISLASYSDTGCLVDLNVFRSGAKVTRSVQPDFVLIRQPVKTEKVDYRRIVIGLLYGAVPALNSLHSIYNFLDKPWVFAHLLMIHRRVGKEKFPLIDQAYYPTHRDVAAIPSFPVVLKVGHGHKGLGKIKVNGPSELQDATSVIGVACEDCTVEPFIESKYDIHIQKIGTSYKAFMRKGISGHWKANQGSAMLEQIAMTDRYKMWVDEVAQLFGGLDICSVEAIVPKEGAEVIYEINDSSMTLLGETQEEDRRLIADLALTKMNHILGVRQAITRRESMGQNAPQNFIKHESPSYPPASKPQPQGPAPGGSPQQMANAQPPAPAAPPVRQPPPTQAPPPPPVAARPQQPAPAVPRPAQPVPVPVPPPNRPPAQPPRPGPPPRPPRQPSLPSQAEPPQTVPQGQQPNAAIPTQGVQPQAGQGQGGEDTMGNLKRTFAGIFGDM